MIFLNQLNGLFVDASNKQVLTDFYSQFTAQAGDYLALLREKKRLVLKTLFVTELNRLISLLADIAKQRGVGKNYSRADWQSALAETIIFFPVYRSYISDANVEVSAADMVAIKSATHLAYEARQDLSPILFAFIDGLLVKPAAWRNRT